MNYTEQGQTVDVVEDGISALPVFLRYRIFR